MKAGAIKATPMQTHSMVHPGFKAGRGASRFLVCSTPAASANAPINPSLINVYRQCPQFFEVYIFYSRFQQVFILKEFDVFIVFGSVAGL